jgi:hypothetical protein
MTAVRRVRWLQACENMNPKAEGCPLLEAATKYHSEERDEKTSLCLIVICIVMSHVSKCTLSPYPLYHHSSM